MKRFPFGVNPSVSLRLTAPLTQGSLWNAAFSKINETRNPTLEPIIRVDHLTHKYAEGGYLRLWIPESDNALRLARLRELVRNRQELRRLFDEIFDREMAANG